MELFNISS